MYTLYIFVGYKSDRRTSFWFSLVRNAEYSVYFYRWNLLSLSKMVTSKTFHQLTFGVLVIVAVIIIGVDSIVVRSIITKKRNIHIFLLYNFNNNYVYTLKDYNIKYMCNIDTLFWAIYKRYMRWPINKNFFCHVCKY